LDGGLAGAELVVGVSADSNNSARKRISACGERITFDGGGGSVGQATGFTACPFAAQPESASTQISSHSGRYGFRIAAILFVLGSDIGHRLAGVPFDLPGLPLCSCLATRDITLTFCGDDVGTAVAPFPAGPERQGDDDR
jgi:hypothetical protein